MGRGRNMALLEIRDLRKAYATPGGELLMVVDIRALDLEARQQVALSGESGSGKTTLLHLIAGILAPDSGTVRLDGVDLGARGEAALETPPS